MVLKGIVLKRRFFLYCLLLRIPALRLTNPKVHAVKGNACH